MWKILSPVIRSGLFVAQRAPSVSWFISSPGPGTRSYKTGHSSICQNITVPNGTFFGASRLGTGAGRDCMKLHLTPTESYACPDCWGKIQTLAAIDHLSKRSLYHPSIPSVRVHPASRFFPVTSGTFWIHVMDPPRHVMLLFKLWCSFESIRMHRLGSARVTIKIAGMIPAAPIYF